MANIIINLNKDTLNKSSNKRFIFKDIMIPLTNKFNSNFDISAIRQSIQNIFSWKKGQRILNPEFGNDLQSFVYEKINNMTVENIKLTINRMLKYEPRIIVTSIDVNSTEETTDKNEINVSITYDIPSLSLKGINDTLIIT